MLKKLKEDRHGRGSTVAQLALAWVLRDPRVTTALVGASSVAQLEDSVGVIDKLDLSDGDLTGIEAALS